MSDTFEFEDKAKVDRLIGTLHDPAATVGDVLTVQADKSIAAQPGGGSMPVQFKTFTAAEIADRWSVALGSAAIPIEIEGTFVAGMAQVTNDTDGPSGGIAVDAIYGYDPNATSDDVCQNGEVMGIDGPLLWNAQTYTVIAGYTAESGGGVPNTLFGILNDGKQAYVVFLNGLPDPPDSGSITVAVIVAG